MVSGCLVVGRFAIATNVDHGATIGQGPASPPHSEHSDAPRPQRMNTASGKLPLSCSSAVDEQDQNGWQRPERPPNWNLNASYRCCLVKPSMMFLPERSSTDSLALLLVLVPYPPMRSQIPQQQIGPVMIGVTMATRGASGAPHNAMC
jgi:hypothetical protein